MTFQYFLFFFSPKKKPKFGFLLTQIRFVGDFIRCVGRICRDNQRFLALSISVVDAAENRTLIDRLETVSSFAIANLTK